MIGSGDTKMNETQTMASWETQAQTEKSSNGRVNKGLWDGRAGAGLCGVRDDIRVRS